MEPHFLLFSHLFWTVCCCCDSDGTHAAHNNTNGEKGRKRKKKIQESKAIHHRPKGGREYGIFGRRAQQKAKPRVAVVFLVSGFFLIHLSRAALSSAGSRGASAPFRCATHEMERLEHRLSLSSIFFCFVHSPLLDISPFFLSSYYLFCFVLFFVDACVVSMMLRRCSCRSTHCKYSLSGGNRPNRTK